MKVLEQWFSSPAAATASVQSWTITRSVDMDRSQGVCGCCSRRLRSIDLSEEARQRMLRQVGEISEAAGEKAAKNWKGFQEWLQRRGRDAYDVIIDGANVGYYKQNFMGAPKHVDYTQIDWVVRHFQVGLDAFLLSPAYLAVPMRLLVDLLLVNP